MAKTIGRFTPSKVPNLPNSLEKWLFTQDGFNDRLGIIPKSISPTELDAIRSDAASGNLGPLYELYEKMVSTDSRIGGIVGSLKATVAGLPLKTVRAETTSASEAKLAEDYRNVVREGILQMDDHSFVSDLVDSYLTGTKAFQLKWNFEKYPNGKILAIPSTPGVIPGQSLRQEMQMLHPKYGQLKFMEMNKRDGTFFSDVDPKRAFVVTDGTALARHDTIGALRKVMGWWITKMYAQLWWIEYVESYGQPMRVASYGAESTPRERAELKNFLNTVGRKKWGLFPEGAQIKLIEAQQSGHISTFSDIINMANHEIAVALSGQTGITQDSAQGSRAKLEVLDGVRFEIVAHIAELVRKGFDYYSDALLAANYGDAYIRRLRPKTRPVVSKPGSRKEKAEVYDMLSKMGVAVSLDEIHDQLGIPQAEEGNLVLIGGKIVEMSADPTKMNEHNEQARANAGKGTVSGRKDEKGGGSDSEDGGTSDSGSDS